MIESLPVIENATPAPSYFSSSRRFLELIKEKDLDPTWDSRSASGENATSPFNTLRSEITQHRQNDELDGELKVGPNIKGCSQPAPSTSILLDRLFQNQLQVRDFIREYRELQTATPTASLEHCSLRVGSYLSRPWSAGASSLNTLGFQSFQSLKSKIPSTSGRQRRRGSKSQAMPDSRKESRFQNLTLAYQAIGDRATEDTVEKQRIVPRTVSERGIGVSYLVLIAYSSIEKVFCVCQALGWLLKMNRKSRSLQVLDSSSKTTRKPMASSLGRHKVLGWDPSRRMKSIKSTLTNHRALVQCPREVVSRKHFVTALPLCCIGPSSLQYRGFQIPTIEQPGSLPTWTPYAYEASNPELRDILMRLNQGVIHTGQGSHTRSDHAFPATNHQQYLTSAAETVAPFTSFGPGEHTPIQYIEGNSRASVATFPSGQVPQTMPSTAQHGSFQLTVPEQDLRLTQPAVPPAFNFPMLWYRLQNGIEIHAEVLAALERVLPQFMLFPSMFAPIMQPSPRQPPPNQDLPKQPLHEQSLPDQLLSEQRLPKHSVPKQRAEEIPSFGKIGAAPTASKGAPSRKVRTESPEVVVTKAGCRLCGFDYSSYEEKYNIRLIDCPICSKGGVARASVAKALPDTREARATHDVDAEPEPSAKQKRASYHHAAQIKDRGAQGPRRRSRSPSKQDARTHSRARGAMGASQSYRQRSPKREFLCQRVQASRHGRSSAGKDYRSAPDEGRSFTEATSHNYVITPPPTQQRRRDPITNKKISLHRHERQPRHNDADGNQASSGYGSQQPQQPSHAGVSSFVDNHLGPWVPFEDREPGFPEQMQREREEARRRNMEQGRSESDNQRGGQRRRR